MWRFGLSFVWVFTAFASVTSNAGTAQKAQTETTIYVDQTNSQGPWDGTTWATAFSTVQEGVDATSEGDTVVVAPGVYVEHVLILTPNITLRSTDPENPEVVANTVMDGGGAPADSSSYFWILRNHSDLDGAGGERNCSG